MRKCLEESDIKGSTRVEGGHSWTCLRVDLGSGIVFILIDGVGLNLSTKLMK